ncbi:MAG TPA: succinate dehydrogenase iron-sulfur subunit [Nitrososphaeraceae archaeon]|nr:succinate dehydrogenase iron-sulfur subunit [Nitrososphaeraceae archaeon]
MTALVNIKNNQTKLEGDKKKDSRIKSNREVIQLRVYRKNSKQSKSSHFDEFTVPVQRWTTVLDALLHAKAYLDNSIAIRYSCRMASCGSCGMKINGIPRLACYTKVSEINENIITCEPLPNFPIIRDLVGDFSDFFQHHSSMEPFIHNQNADIVDKNNLTEFIQSPEDVENYLQFSYCIKCGLCYSACPSVASDTKFPGPQALAQAYRYVADNRDDATRSRMNIVDNKHGIWRCHFAGSCSVVCPKGVDPALGIQLLRGHLMSFSKNDKKLAESRTRILGKR